MHRAKTEKTCIETRSTPCTGFGQRRTLTPGAALKAASAPRSATSGAGGGRRKGSAEAKRRGSGSAGNSRGTG